MSTVMDVKDVKCVDDYVEEYQDTTDLQFEAGEEKKLVRKIDLFLMPTIWLMYLMSYMDRTNIGNAKIAGMNDDLGLSSSEYSMALVIFFISYVFFEVPSNLSSQNQTFDLLAYYHGLVGHCYLLHGCHSGLQASLGPEIRRGRPRKRIRPWYPPHHLLMV
jgi:sugar phosphate permease